MAEPLRQLLADFQVRVDPEGNLRKGNLQVDALKAKFQGLGATVNGAAAGLRGRFGGAMQSLREGFAGLGGGLMNLRNGLGVLGAGLALGRLKGLVDEIGGIGEEASRLGVTNAEFQRLGVLAAQNATSVQALGTAFRNVGKAAVDPAKETTAAFRALGVNVKDSQGEFKSRNDLFFETAGALADITNENERATLAQQLYGRSALEVLPLLANGRAGLEAQRKELERLRVISDAQIATADRLSDRWAMMQFKIKVLLGQALEKLLPVLESLTGIFDDIIDQIDGTNVAISALIIAAVPLIPVLLSVAAAAAPWAALYLIIDELVTTLRGGDSYTRDFIESLFGDGATEKALASIKSVKDALVDLFNLVFRHRGGGIFGKAIGVAPDDVEARRQERQAAADSGTAVEQIDSPVLKWFADATGITDEVMQRRRASGIDPRTGRELPAPRFVNFGPPTAEGSVAGNAPVTIGDTNVSIVMGNANPKQVGDEMVRVLERNREAILQDVR